MIIETILPLQNNAYPFDQQINSRTKGLVEELQYFTDKQKLQQRRCEMRKNCKIFQQHFIIKLLHILQEGLCLHYIYEHVSDSLGEYIKKQLEKDKNDKLKEMNAKLLLRRITLQINCMVAELSKLRIETHFHYGLLGVQNDKIKLFVGSLHQVGRKSQLLLKEHYRSKKEITLKILQNEFNRITGWSQNFILKTNKPFFNRKQENSLYNTLQPSQSSNNLSDNCESKEQGINQTKEKPRRFSQTKWEADSCRKEQAKMRKTHYPDFARETHHKSKMGKSRPFQKRKTKEDDFMDGTSYSHSKSIRIQMEKNMGKRQRRDSYKVKIITCHEYEMEDISPNDIFSKCHLSDSGSDSSRTKTPKKNIFDEKVKKATDKARQLLKTYLQKRPQSRE